MTVDASRSCLGLETCVGSVIRQIVDARVLLTATAPPALPGSRMSDGSPAPPLNRIMPVFRLACRHRDMPGDGPDKACQFFGLGALVDSSGSTATLRTAGIGASRPLSLAPAKVPSPNR